MVSNLHIFRLELPMHSYLLQVLTRTAYLILLDLITPVIYGQK